LSHLGNEDFKALSAKPARRFLLTLWQDGSDGQKVAHEQGQCLGEDCHIAANGGDRLV
jgi:hypothetical protein